MEKEALIASGVREKDKIAHYVGELDRLHRQFIREMMPAPDLVTKARALFDWLWTAKPARYKPSGNYRLSDVIDAQISQDTQTVGNCLGLTLLYNCLLRRMGIKAEALYVENAFGIGPHVLTILALEDGMIDIENILPDGFGYKGHINDPSRTRWGDRELVADICLSVGNESFGKGEYFEALKNYNIAIELNPQFEKAHLNKAIALDKIETEENAGPISGT